MMSGTSVNLILIDQEYTAANHKFFWKEFAEEDGNITIVVNISADYVVSVIRHKLYRIKEAKKGAMMIGPGMYLMRPLFLLRHDVLPLSLLFSKPVKRYYQNKFWKSVSAIVPDILNRNVFMLSYSSSWLDILAGSHPHLKSAYYLYDEFRHNPDGTVHPKRSAMDILACQEAGIILAMSEKLLENRKEFTDKIKVFGNGASAALFQDVKPMEHFPNSVGIIGNIRNWIDKELLLSLIQKNPDLTFIFAGPVEADMQQYLDGLLTLSNVKYLGVFKKEDVPSVYTMVDCVIVPYMQNGFIQSTRPIKIVEAIFAGTPVVTIPVSGYKECDFLRFASDPDSFGAQVRYAIEHPISRDCVEYKSFVSENSWEGKAVELKTIKYSLLNDPSDN